MFVYPFRDLRLAALAPWNLVAQMAEHYLCPPTSPLAQTQAGQELASSIAALERNTRLHTKPSFDLPRIRVGKEDVPVSEMLLSKTPFCRLLSFKRTSKSESLQEQLDAQPSILIVAPYSGHYATLMREMVEALLPNFNVTITDWINAKMVPMAYGHFNLEDQISAISRMIYQMGSSTHIIALGQASVTTLAATALLAEADAPIEPPSLTLIEGPIDPAGAPSPLSEVALTHPLSWFQEKHLDFVPAYYPGAFRTVYPGYMRLRNHMTFVKSSKITQEEKYFAYLMRGCEISPRRYEKMYEEFLSVSDIPGELYMEYVSRIFQKSELAKGQLTCCGKKIDLTKIKRTALLTVEAEFDEFSPPGHTRAALDLCSNIPESMKKSHLEIGMGHYGLFMGRKWFNVICPLIKNFMAEHGK